jgi:hypothetical protein
MESTTGIGIRVLTVIRFNEDSTAEEVQKIRETITETYFRDLAEKAFSTKGYSIDQEDLKKLTIELKSKQSLRVNLG